MDDEAILLGASIGFAALAADFCTQPETFSVFFAWAKTKGEPLEWTPEKLAPLVRHLYGLSQVAGEALFNGVQ